MTAVSAEEGRVEADQRLLGAPRQADDGRREGAERPAAGRQQEGQAAR